MLILTSWVLGRRGLHWLCPDRNFVAFQLVATRVVSWARRTIRSVMEFAHRDGNSRKVISDDWRSTRFAHEPKLIAIPGGGARVTAGRSVLQSQH